MSPDQIRLVRQSFVSVAPVAEEAGALFYAKLFMLDPAISDVFSSSDMKVQTRKLLEMIGSAVRLLDHPERLDPVLYELGKRHVEYGMQEANYATVGSTLIETLATALGPDFTPAVREAWNAMYTNLARRVQAGAAGS